MTTWTYVECPAGRELSQVEVLFQRINVSQIEEEVQRLKSI